MAVTSINADGVIWGGGNRDVHCALIAACRDRIGETPFLTRFQRSFDDGYNSVVLEEETDEDVRAYRDCIVGLLERPEPLRPMFECYGEDKIRSALSELVYLIDRERLHAP